MELCPLCAYDDNITTTDLGAGLTEYRCSGHNPPHTWTHLVSPFKPQKGDASDGSGLAAELGMYDDLPQLIGSDPGWIEYGIVERRFREAYPESFAAVTDRYPHHEQGHHGYTASMYIAMILGALRDRGVVVSMGKPGKATGYWSYNTGVHYWARPPGPPTEELITYESWATAAGRDPSRA